MVNKVTVIREVITKGQKFSWQYSKDEGRGSSS